jgi:hypothetical protein
MDEKRGNPRFTSIEAVFKAGISAWKADCKVFAENVSCFTSENDSSLGT